MSIVLLNAIAAQIAVAGDNFPARALIIVGILAVLAIIITSVISHRRGGGDSDE